MNSPAIKPHSRYLAASVYNGHSFEQYVFVKVRKFSNKNSHPDLHSFKFFIQKYLELAEHDKKRYIDELAEYQQSEEYQNFLNRKRLKSREGSNYFFWLIHKLQICTIYSNTISGFPLGLENLEKWEGIFQSGKSQGILNRLEKSGKITQNTGKLR